MHSPFKFLDSYTREDHDIYFGRTNETEALYTSVFKSKMVLLYGVSGTGKSSLIQCGLANKFQESDWLPVFVRRGTDMLDSLFQSLIQTHIEAPRQPKKRSAKSFLKLLQSLYLDHFKPVYLIFDQFEELFIFGNKEERNEFVQLMEALQESEVQVKVIFSIREEYLAMLTEFEDRLPELFQNRIRVERMHFPQAKEVIQGACQYAKIEIEEGFEEQLLEKLTGGKKELELTYLQVLLDRLWKKSEEGKNGFTLTLLESMGHISDLLGQFLEEQINELEEPEQGLTVLKTFVSVQGTKKQLTFEEIHQGCLSLGKDVKESGIQDLLQRFTDLRILRDKDESGRYELRHDSLAAKIYEKITLAEKELMEVRQFVEQAYQLYDKKGIILSADSLNFVAPYRQKLFLKPKIRAFIDASQHYYERKAKRRRRILTWSISAALVIAIVSGIFIWRDLQATREAARIATAHNLANEAMNLLQDDPKQAFKTAVDAYNMEPDYLSKKAVMNAFYQGPFERYSIPILSDRLVQLSSDKKYWFVLGKGYYNQTIQVYDVISGKLFSEINYHNSPLYNTSDEGLSAPILYDSISNSCATLSRDSIVCSWSISGDLKFKKKFPENVIGIIPGENSFYIISDTAIHHYGYNGNCMSSVFFKSKIVSFKKVDGDKQFIVIYVGTGRRMPYELACIDLRDLSILYSDEMDESNGETSFYQFTIVKGVFEEKLLAHGAGDRVFLWDMNANTIKYQHVPYVVRSISTIRQVGDELLIRCDYGKFYLICRFMKSGELQVLKRAEHIKCLSDNLFLLVNGGTLKGFSNFSDSSKFSILNSKFIARGKYLDHDIIIVQDIDSEEVGFYDYEGNQLFGISPHLVFPSDKKGNCIYRQLSPSFAYLSLDGSPNCLFINSKDNIFLWNNKFSFNDSPLLLKGQFYVKTEHRIKVYAIEDFYSLLKIVKNGVIEPNFNPDLSIAGEQLAYFNRRDSSFYVIDTMKQENKYDLIYHYDGKKMDYKGTLELSGFNIFQIDSVIAFLSDRCGVYIFNSKTNTSLYENCNIHSGGVFAKVNSTNYAYVPSKHDSIICLYFNKNIDIIDTLFFPTELLNSKKLHAHIDLNSSIHYFYCIDSSRVYKFNIEKKELLGCFSANIYPLDQNKSTIWNSPQFGIIDTCLYIAFRDSVKIYSVHGDLVSSIKSNISELDKIYTISNSCFDPLLLTGGDYSYLWTATTNRSTFTISNMNEYVDGSYSKLIKDSRFSDYSLENDQVLFTLQGKSFGQNEGISFYDLSMNHLMTLKLLTNVYRVRSHRNGDLDCLWCSKIGLFDNEKQENWYFSIIKLPVTVPRMFEILQETGLDTTYGFDNIPKNF